MQYRKFGRTEMEVSALGFGAAEIGSAEVDDSTVARLLAHALDKGVNVFDTAACYGQSERRIGETLWDRRQRIYLFSKCGHARGLDDAGGSGDWDAKLLSRSIDQSLRRLRTEYLDLMQLHSCGLEQLRNGDVIDALVRARDRGKVRYLGYSGDGEAAGYAVQSGVFDALQTSVNIAEQAPIEGLLDEALQAGMGVIAKRPIANAVWMRETEPDSDYLRPYWKRLKNELDYAFLEADPPETVDLALRFTLFTPGVTTAIVGTTDREHLDADVAAGEAGPLADSLYEQIRLRWREVYES